MSRETMHWLNSNTLIGFTEKRGKAWHSRAGYDNHYPGPVPAEDVRRRLFDWTAEEHPIYAETGRNTFTHVPGRKAIMRSDNGHVMGVFSDKYQPHQYGEWLLDNVSTLLDDGELFIGSAGLLREGAVGWVSIEVPDNIVTPEGVEFRPNLLASHSFDGSIATTYKRVVTNVVCDNTQRVALGEYGQQFKVRSTSRSMSRIAEARDALNLVYAIGDSFAEEVRQLCDQSVTDKQFEQIVEKLAPVPDVKSAESDGRANRGVTMAHAKRDKLWSMWMSDDRVAPWRGSAYGAYQCFSTYRHHEGHVRSLRPERNMLNAADGSTESADQTVIQKVMSVVGAS